MVAPAGPARASPPSRQHLEQFARHEADESGRRIDEQTVDDLELHAAVNAVFEPCSKAGHYAAYAALVSGTADVERSHATLKADVRRNAETLEPLLKPLRHSPDDPLPFLFLGARYPTPAWANHLYVVPLLLLIGIALVASGAVAPAGWTCLVVALAGMAYAQIRLHAFVISWKTVRAGICTVLATAESLIASTDVRHTLPLADIQRIRKALARSESQWAWLNEYLNLVMLREYRSMLADIRRVERDVDVVRRAYLHCAGIDCQHALATAPARLGIPWSDAQDDPATRADTLSFEGLVHPGLAAPVAFSGLQTDVGGTFISGQNAAGKSTLLRTVGVNALFLRAFAGAFCTRCAGEVTGVISSITATDSMANRESLYAAELRRCRQVLSNVESTDKVLVLVDEPFRGTNNLEALSASASVLEFLASRARTVVVTHNVLLCSLLPQFRALQIKRASKHISVEPGVLADPNGLQLFDDVVQDAKLSARARYWFERISREHLRDLA
ncbi:MAG: MutS-related protein [Roseateles sp.]|uniref:MutS-related protein n=1 Tax=Roseateles sp. TaxID=1971397 RepID=UPI004037439A